MSTTSKRIVSAIVAAVVLAMGVTYRTQHPTPQQLEASRSLSAPFQVPQFRLDGPRPEYQRSSHWPTVRKHYIEGHPTCAGCGTTEKLEVHHVLPFHLHPEKELDPTNLITLCETPEMHCHFRLGHLGNWKSWNPDVQEDAARQLRKIKERP